MNIEFSGKLWFKFKDFGNKEIEEELGINLNDENLDVNKILKNIEANHKSAMRHINLLKIVLQNREKHENKIFVR